MNLLDRHTHRKKLQRLIQSRIPKGAAWEARVGDGSGVIKLPGHDEFRYVRPMNSDIPVIVHRGDAPDIEGVRVWVGRRFKRDNLRILEASANNNSGNTTAVAAHAPTHLWRGSDPVYIDTVQIINELVYASGGMIITINEGWVMVNGQAVHVDATTIDMDDYMVAAGAAYDLVRVDVDGVVDIQEGTPVGSYADLTWDDVPAAEMEYAVLAVVRVYLGQTALSRDYDWPDVIDVRYAVRAEGQLTYDLDDLTDVTISSTDDHELLAYDDGSGNWINMTAAEAIKLDDLGAPDDNTDLDASAWQHGLLPKLSGNATDYLDGSGAWSIFPSVGGGDITWEVDGILSVVADAGQPYVVPRGCTINTILIYVQDQGSAGSTVIDVNVNAASIFPVATKPTVAFDDANGYDERIPDTVTLAQYDVVSWDIDSVATDAAGIRVIILFSAISISPVYDPGLCEGRLTYTSGVPVTTANVDNAQTLYWCPYKGPRISLYDGAGWVTISSTEKSITLVGTTASKPYDVFGYLSAGNLILELLVWTNATTRATALVYQDGVLVKSGDATRKYLGALYIDADGNSDDSYVKRFLHNYYNRVATLNVKYDDTDHAYTTGAWRYYNNDATNKFEFVTGLEEDMAGFGVTAFMESNDGVSIYLAGDLDAATSGDRNYGYLQHMDARQFTFSAVGQGTALPGIGYHYVAMIEYGGAGGWYGYGSIWRNAWK